MIEIIPAIDIIEGKCVRLSQGDYCRKKVYNEEPLEVAKEFETYGLKRLHLVDLEGAKANHVVNLKVLEKITSHTKLIVDFGGGIKTDQDIRSVFEAGANQVTVGSIAVKNPEKVLTWIERYSREKIILGADVKNKIVAITGWLDDTGLSLWEYLENYISKGIKNVICTDIAKDGMLQGSSISLYKEILDRYPEIKLIASGGITTINELDILEMIGVYGAIIGKAIYEGTITIKELSGYVDKKNSSMS